jgi:hypothetical protein
MTLWFVEGADSSVPHRGVSQHVPHQASETGTGGCEGARSPVSHCHVNQQAASVATSKRD